MLSRSCADARASRVRARCRSGSRAVGLYPYLGVEVMIWMIYALGFNLLLGYAGLPSFGHGAYFGVGAYAFGLAQLHFGIRICGRLSGRGDRWRARIAGALVALLHLAPPRHLLRAAHHRLRPDLLVRRHQVAQRDARRGRPAQHQARPAFGFSLDGWRRLYYFCFAVFVVVVLFLWRVRAFALRPRARRDQAERDARALRRLQRVAVQMARLHPVGAGRRAGRRPVRARAAVGLSERDEPAPVGLRGDDGAGRRRPGVVLGAGARRGAVLRRARPARRLHRDLAALVRAAVHAIVLFKPEGLAGMLRRETMFEAKHLHKRFGDHVVLEDVSMRFEAGACRASWGRTARARPPASTCSPAATRPTAAA